VFLLFLFLIVLEVRMNLEKNKYEFINSNLIYKPKITIPKMTMLNVLDHNDSMGFSDRKSPILWFLPLEEESDSMISPWKKSPIHTYIHTYIHIYIYIYIYIKYFISTKYYLTFFSTNLRDSTHSLLKTLCNRLLVILTYMLYLLWTSNHLYFPYKFNILVRNNISIIWIKKLINYSKH
jgi:hypothetical protein